MSQTIDYLIQQAAGAHREAVVRLDDLAVAGSRREVFLSRAIDAGECWVAVQGEAVLGFVVLDRSFFDQFFVSLLIVDPGRRRKGIATRLMRRTETVCPAAKLFTSTNESNVPMQRLCEKLGYVRSGRIENLDERDPEVVYFKRLPVSEKVQPPLEQV